MTRLATSPPLCNPVGRRNSHMLLLRIGFSGGLVYSLMVLIAASERPSVDRLGSFLRQAHLLGVASAAAQSHGDVSASGCR